MKKIVLFLIFSLLFQGFYASTTMARGLSRIVEEEQTFELPYREPVPNLPNYRVYNTDDKIIISSRVPIAGLQFETNGSWDLTSDLVSDGWDIQENDGTVLVYNLSDKVISGYTELFNYSGNLEIDRVIAADRQGRLVKKWSNEKTDVYKASYISEKQVRVYSDFFNKVSSLEATKVNSVMTAATSTTLFAGNASGVPGQNDILFHISMDNNSSDIVGVQFNLNDLPNWITASSSVSQISGFDSYVNDYNGAAEVMVINLSGGTLPIGNNIPLVDLYLSMDNDAVLGDIVDMNFSNIVISDSLGNPLVGEGVGGSISAGIKGDINSDGEIDILDIVKAINFSIHLEIPSANELWASDMNGDGYINILDVVQIINLVFIPIPDGLTVALATDTPASSVVVGSASQYPFTKISLVAGGEDVIIDSLTIERGGVAQDAAFAYLDILDADTMLPLNNYSRTLNGSHQAVFTDNITIEANTTKDIYLAATMTSSLASYAGEMPTLGLADITVVNATPIDAPLPIFGNPQTLNGTISIGNATITAGIDNPGSSTVMIGTTDYIATSIRLIAGSAEDLTVNSIIITNNGSATPSAVVNAELKNALTGEVYCSWPVVTTDELVCTNIGEVINSGQNTSFNFEVDLVGEPASTISYDIDGRADVLVTGNTYGYNILPYYPNSSEPYFNANNTTIGYGTIMAESVALESGVIGEGTPDAELGKFNFVASGEEMSINVIGWNFTLSTTSASADYTDITNIKIYDELDNLVAGPADFTTAVYTDGSSIVKATVTTTDSFIVPTGGHIYTVRADLNNNFSANDTIQVGVEMASADIDSVSGYSVIGQPSGNTQSTLLTIGSSYLAISVSSNPAAQTVVAGAQDFVVANFILDASNSTENIEIVNIKPVLHTTTGAYPNQMSGWTLSVDGADVEINAESTTCGPTSCNTAGDSSTTTLTLTDNALIIPAGESKVVEVRVDVGTGATLGTFSTGAQSGSVTAVDSDAQIVNPIYTASDGQLMTLVGSGTLHLGTLSDPVSAIVVGGSEVEVGRFTLQANYEGANVNYISFSIANPDGGVVGNYSQLDSLYLYGDGGISLGSVVVNSYNSTITPSGMNLALDEEKTYIVKATFSNPSESWSGPGVRVALSNIDADGQSTGSAVTVVGMPVQPFNTFSVYKSLPTVAQIDFTGSDNIAGSGTYILKKFSVTADSAGPIGLYKFTFGVSTSSESLTDSGYYLYESDSSSSLGNVIAKGSDITVTHETGQVAILEVYLDVNDDTTAAPALEHRVIALGATKYYTLRGYVTEDGTANNGSISTVFAGDPAFAATALEDTTAVEADAADDFIWSDLNFDLYSTSTATNMMGWFNGYRVPGLDTTSSTGQTITD